VKALEGEAVRWLSNSCGAELDRIVRVWEVSPKGQPEIVVYAGERQLWVESDSIARAREVPPKT